MNRTALRCRQRPSTGQIGVSLIELMIGMALGLILIATIGNAYLSAKQGFRTQNALSRIQEGARYAFEFMAEDIRMAGYTGGPANYAQITQPAGWDGTLQDLKQLPLIGYASGAAPAWVAPIAGDSLSVVHADTDNEYALDTSVSPNPSATAFTLASWPDPAPAVGDTYVGADYTWATAFQVSAVDGGARTVSFTSGAGTLTGGTESRRVYPVNGVTYFIAQNPGGEPALYRFRLALGQSEELVEGVSNMQITYGVDTDAAPDRAVNAYWTADQVTAGTDGTTTLPNLAPATYPTANIGYWRSVLSVRIVLTMVSREGESMATSGARRMTKVFTNTIAVRNRL